MEYVAGKESQVPDFHRSFLADMEAPPVPGLATSVFLPICPLTKGGSLSKHEVHFFLVPMYRGDFTLIGTSLL